MFLTQFKITTTQQNPTHHFHHILLVRTNHKISPDSRTGMIVFNIEGKSRKLPCKKNRYRKTWEFEDIIQQSISKRLSFQSVWEKLTLINCIKGFSYILHSYWVWQMNDTNNRLETPSKHVEPQVIHNWSPFHKAKAPAWGILWYVSIHDPKKHIALD